MLGPRPQAVLRLEGFDALPRVSSWTQTTIVVARSRCRLRWFRLAGIPANERLAALRLQVQAWRPFESTAARLALFGEDGFAIAWDGAAAQQQLVANGLTPQRCQFMPETLMQPVGPDGLRLLRCAEGFEAQCWRDGFLRASRWWAYALTAQDWQEFVHASGSGRDAGGALPEPQSAALTGPWAKHYPLHATADGAEGLEQRVVFVAALALTLATGMVAHQLWGAHQQGQSLARQIVDVKAATEPVLTARDAAMAAVDEVDKLAAWFALPLPVDVIGYLNDTLGRSGVQVKNLDLEGDKLRLGLQLTPNATRAGIVKDLQSGGWFVDVSEVRADNARGLLTMEMRIVGLRPPAAGTGDATAAAPAGVAAPAPAPAMATQAQAPITQAPKPAPAPAPATAQVSPAPVRPAPVPQGPAKPIIAKPDANGMPPPDVFNAIPNR